MTLELPSGAVLPTAFNWPVFALAFVLMAAPVVRIARGSVPSAYKVLTALFAPR